ncbi:hypothetical protein PFISCL1PPCAC_3790, partial [Pristionchus fissidentatus]
MQFDELSPELRALLLSVLSRFGIDVPDNESVDFERIGLDRGYNSAIHRVKFNGRRRSIAVKITDHEECDVVSMLHNRELAFYTWLSGYLEEDDADEQDLKQLLRFYGGTKCDTEPGVLILNDLSNSVCPHPCYIKGYSVDLIFRIVKQIAGYQAAYLSADKEATVGRELLAYTLPADKSVPRLGEVQWMTEKMRQYLTEWTRPENLFAIHTSIPEDVEGITPTLAHCDLWPGNMIFEKRGKITDLLAILDWQCFKIGNPLIDIASLIGESLTTEDRREHTEAILRYYVDEISKRRHRFKRTFEMTYEKAEQLLSSALRWPCIELLYAVILVPTDDVKEDGQTMGRLSIRLKELLSEVIESQ